MNRTKIMFFFISLIVIVSCSWALAEESISITTYYPSPYGVYNEMRLYPHSIPVTPCDPTTEGTMFYNSTSKEIQVCNGLGGWGSNSGFWAGSGNDIHNTNSGNVGIGITNPQTLLHLKRANEIDIWIEGDSPDIKFIHGPGTYYTWRVGLDENNGNFLLSKNQKNTGDPDQIITDNIFAINPSGGVGIGASSINPDSTFQVSSPGWAEARIQSTTNGGGADIHFETPDYDSWSIGMDDTGDYFRIEDQGVNERFVITPAGRIGIGINNPGFLLELAGGAHCDGTGAWVAGSDRAYKKDIDYDFQYGLQTIEQLKPVYYIHKEDKTNKKQIGFIAQDVKEVIPEVVDGVEGTYGLAYDRLVPVLVNAIKEQQKQIEDLKTQINELKGK